LDVPRSTVDSCRRRGKLPEPDLMIGIHPYWEWTNLELCGCSPCAQPSHPVCT
jgi:hypothetical protein